RAEALALYRMAAVVAPALGPWLGGWITDNFGWRCIFLVNVPLGCLSLLLASKLVPPEKRRAITRRPDVTGMLLIALALGCLQVVLDRGQQEDWFSSGLMRMLAVTAVCAAASFIVWELDQEHPAVDIRLFRNLNFLASNLFLFVCGFVFFGI